MGDFSGKSVVITGGGSGIGLGIATELASRGASLGLIGRDEQKLLRGAGQIRSVNPETEVHTYAIDVRDAEAVADSLQAASSDLGGLSALVNNAAGNFVLPAEEMSPNGFKAVVDIVLVGTFNCSRAFALLAKEAAGPGGAIGHRSILNVIATYAWTGHPGTVHSAASKAGVLALTRTLAVEWARLGIRVNAIAPGPTDTEGAAAALWPNEADRAALIDSVPMRRFATLPEVSKSAAFLLSDDASYITGEVLTVDGGQWLGKQIFGGTESPST